ncbi:MAG: histidine phosphatase family protein [Holophagaceae bacterium]
MATLLLVRHGPAEEGRPGLADAGRALTPEGWIRTRAAMKGLVALGFVPDRGCTSPFRRAVETMDCLAEAAAEASGRVFPMESWEGLQPEGDPAVAEAWLRQRAAAAGADATLAVTSHEPFLSLLIAHLTGKRVDVKKASCTVISWSGGGWSFVKHLKPSELRGE